MHHSQAQRPESEVQVVARWQSNSIWWLQTNR